MKALEVNYYIERGTLENRTTQLGHVVKVGREYFKIITRATGPYNEMTPDKVEKINPVDVILCPAIEEAIRQAQPDEERLLDAIFGPNGENQPVVPQFTVLIHQIHYDEDGGRDVAEYGPYSRGTARSVCQQIEKGLKEMGKGGFLISVKKLSVPVDPEKIALNLEKVWPKGSDYLVEKSGPEENEEG